MELCDGGSLYNWLRGLAPRTLSQLQLLRPLCDVAEAVSFLHSRRILHRDLSLRNVLRQGAGDAAVHKLGDLGIAVSLPAGEDDVADGLLAALPWRSTAPEAIAARRFSAAGDVWSLGVLTWELYGYAEADAFADARGPAEVCAAVAACMVIGGEVGVTPGSAGASRG
eukprot:gene15490-19175_t